MPGRYRFHSTRPAPWKRVGVASSVDRQSKGGVNFRHTARRCFSLWLPRSGKAWEDRPACAIHGWCCSPLLVSTGTSSYVSLDSSKNRATLAGRMRAGDAGRPAADAPVLATVEGWVRARELERLAQSDAAYRWLAGGVPLNYQGLVDFRVESVEVLDGLLTQSVTALIGEGLVKLVEITVDGTKICASASKPSFKTGAKIARGRSRSRRATTPPRRVLDDAVASFATGRREFSVHERELRLFECAGIASNGGTGCAA